MRAARIVLSETGRMFEMAVGKDRSGDCRRRKEVRMLEKTVGIGHQDFGMIRSGNYFYVDKTHFIKEWWEDGDSVTLITRPRRFGKTLTMSMTEAFFSVKYEEKGELFAGLAIWEDEKYRNLQGSFPVISLSFANVKEKDYATTVRRICQIVTDLYDDYRFLLEGDVLSEEEKRYFKSISESMPEVTVTMAIHRLSRFLHAWYGKKVIILLDEYDTPMQEAYVSGFWDELVSFIRSMFNATFKTNPYLERALMTGITRVSKESIFSDLNNIEVVTTTSEKYEDSFGFTEEEVFAALDEYGLSDKKQELKDWYDGFTFGRRTDIYNPWSILNYLDKKQFAPYWANTSSNSLVGTLIRKGSKSLKLTFECPLLGEPITAELDEQIVYDQLDNDEQAVWSLLLAGGYLKVKNFKAYMSDFGEWKQEYELELTNFEVKTMFRRVVKKWFASALSAYNDFVKALISGDVDAMNEYMNRVAETTFSSFDTGKKPSGSEPERFYHGFVLGLMVDLTGRYILTSNRESGFGRYDVMLEPVSSEKDDGIILEFKVFQPKKERNLEDTVEAALKQIEDKKYDMALLARGIPKERIHKYGFAFRGKEVLIGEG